MFRSIARSLFCVLILSSLMTFAASRAWASGCPGTPGQSTGPDVIVGVLSHDIITNYNSLGGIEALSVGTTSCNLGNTPLIWQSGGINHPVIGQNLFRLKLVDGSRRFEQLGQSWLKHGFYALSDYACCSTCFGTDGSTLGVGCSDPYSSSRNGGQSALGPKWAVNATTGVHTHSVTVPGFSGSVARRLQVKIEDLEPSTGGGGINATRYFVEAQYVAADDAAAGNKNNNASYRPVSVTGSGASWDFARTGATQREKAAIFAWRDVDPAVFISEVTTAEANGWTALVLLGSQATDLGGGMWHYEFALQNLNSDRSIRSFSLPIRPGATVTNLGFRDVDYHSGDGPSGVNCDGTDWPPVHSYNEVSWETVTFNQNVGGNAIRWGTMYNFRFDSDVPPWPGKGEITMGYFKPAANQPDTVLGLGFSPMPCWRGDMNGDGSVDSLDVALFVERLVNAGASFRERCAGDLAIPTDGQILLDDLPEFVDCLLNGGCG